MHKTIILGISDNSYLNYEIAISRTKANCVFYPRIKIYASYVSNLFVYLHCLMTYNKNKKL